MEYFTKKVQVGSRGVIDTVESELFEWLSRFSWRIRNHMRNGFSTCIWDLEGIVWWKNEGRDTVPLVKKKPCLHSDILDFFPYYTLISQNRLKICKNVPVRYLVKLSFLFPTLSVGPADKCYQFVTYRFRTEYRYVVKPLTYSWLSFTFIGARLFVNCFP
jgi:hypothetical protein